MTVDEKSKSLAKGLGRNLKFLRESKGMTQEQLATEFEVSQKTISSWEIGRREPGLYHLCRMKQFFDVDLYELIYGQITPPIPMYAINIMRLRQRHGMTQKDMANLLKVTDSAVSKYESGKIEPTLSQIMVIADFFGVTMDQLVKTDLMKGAE